MPANVYWPDRKFNTVKEAVDDIAKHDSRLGEKISLPYLSYISKRIQKLLKDRDISTYGKLLEYVAVQTWGARFDASYGSDSKIEVKLRKEDGFGKETLAFLRQHIESRGLVEYFEPPVSREIPVNFEF